jgi:hypothetical protein
MHQRHRASRIRGEWHRASFKLLSDLVGHPTHSTAVHFGPGGWTCERDAKEQAERYIAQEVRGA